jgi:hypothetical protein
MGCWLAELDMSAADCSDGTSRAYTKINCSGVALILQGCAIVFLVVLEKRLRLRSRKCKLYVLIIFKFISGFTWAGCA